MCNRNIADVRVRLEEAVSALLGDSSNPAERYEKTEELAIQVLDSEHDWYPPGQLQELLMSYLYIRQIELGLLSDTDPLEE